VHFIHDMMAEVASSAFKVSQVLCGNLLRGFIQQLLDAAQVLPETSKRFRKRFICRVSNAVLLQRKRRIEQRTPTRKPLNCIIRGTDVRLNRRAHLFVKARKRIVPGCGKRQIHAPAQIFVERFAAPVQLIAMKGKYIVELSLKLIQCLLLEACDARKELVEFVDRLIRALNGSFQLSRLSVRRFAKLL